MDEALAAVRITGASFPAAASAVQAHGEIEMRGVKARLAALEDPITPLHPDVPALAGVLYDVARGNAGRSGLLDPGAEFYERYAKPLALLEGIGQVTATRALSGGVLGGLRPSAPFMLYMATRCEDPARLAAAVARMESAKRGQWLDGFVIAEEIGIPWIVIAALFDIYEARGLGLRSKLIGTARYLARA